MLKRIFLLPALVALMLSAGVYGDDSTQKLPSDQVMLPQTTAKAKNKDVRLEDIDKNFRTAELKGQKFNFFDTYQAPFEIEGFPWFENKKGEEFYRFPLSAATGKGEINSGALWLAHQTAGGAIRFRTNSPVIAIRAKLVYSSDMNHMSRLGSAGFDLYCGIGANAKHIGSAPTGRDQQVLETVFHNPASGEQMYDFTLNMPLYGGCKDIEIGIVPGSKLEAPTPHKYTKPILFYGSSITQGACASRPGNAYTTRVCREIDAPQINFGFSGSARGEVKVAELIAGLDLTAFVMDYDFNAPSVEHLEQTHEKFFRIIREKNPNLPIIIMSKCSIWPEFRNNALEMNMRRRAVIRKTYENAIASGDKNVYFIDGETLFGKDDRTSCTVDLTHPNDMGFERMSNAVLPVLKKALENAK